MTSSFVFENAEQARAMFADEVQGNIYTRFSNPNNDEFIAKSLEKLKRVSGSRIFKTISGSIATPIRSNDMNGYLKNVMGPAFTCKDFRTYASNILFIDKLSKKKVPETKKELVLNLKNVYDEVASDLGHTSAISKKSYVLPIIEKIYKEKPNSFVNQDSKKMLNNFLKDY